jgi:predicted patatin/cPLA2 family phospholipase
MSDDEYKPIYQFKNYYEDCWLENQDELNQAFYNGNEKIIVIKHEINNYYYDDDNNSKCVRDCIFYYIKNNPNNIITYKDLYDEIDKQSLNYKNILTKTDHIFIECIDKNTDVQYDMWCGS